MERTLYGCPMHPDVEQESPGVCPKCGMKLEQRTRPPTNYQARESSP
jgi:Cu+-exporting ATPase